MPPAKHQVSEKRKAAVVHTGPSLPLSFCGRDWSASTSSIIAAVRGNTDLKKNVFDTLMEIMAVAKCHYGKEGVLETNTSRKARCV